MKQTDLRALEDLVGNAMKVSGRLLQAGLDARDEILALREENAKLKAQAERAEHGWSGCDILRTEAYTKIRRLRDVLESAPEPDGYYNDYGDMLLYSKNAVEYIEWFHGARAEALKNG